MTVIIWQPIRDAAVWTWVWAERLWWAWLAAAIAVGLAVAVQQHRARRPARTVPAEGWREDPDIPRFGGDPSDGGEQP